MLDKQLNNEIDTEPEDIVGVFDTEGVCHGVANISFSEETGEKVAPEGYALWISRMERRLVDAVEALKHTETIEELTDLNNAVFFIEEIAAKLPSDQPDAIEGVTVKSDVRSHGIYNLQGVRMNSENLPAGLYIVNGKKVVIK